MDGTNYEVPYYGAFPTPHSNRFVGPNIRRFLILNTVSLHSSLYERDHVSQTENWQYYYCTYFNFQILGEKSRRQNFWNEQQEFPAISLNLISL
jgi:hypothetical protein